NHSATHPDLNSTPLESYFADIVRAQDLIDAAGPAAQRWFRAPFLHTGDDRATKDSLASLLEAGGYRIAPVTVDNQEWVYAAVYAVALSHPDETLARRVIDAYLEHLEQSVAYYEGVSMAVFGREIPQTLLLHANQLNADALGGVIDMLAARGYRFISMAEALSDSAYARPDRYVGSRGLSWLLRWAIEDGRTVPPEPREAAWVARAFRERTTRGP